ncbi:hypothetical protein [Streptomyces griseorubiginosus]|uniref:hypothetical protein n=1 Tax=Streptomyces griseorubiginosus TaxID=67304 RepID=UPI0036EEC58F
MILTTADQRAEANAALGFSPTCDPDGIIRVIRALRYTDRHRGDAVAVANALGWAQTVVRRLLDIEAEYSKVRATIARLEVANHRGDDYTLADLAFELQQDGIDLKTDYDHADDLARAAEQEGLL